MTPKYLISACEKVELPVTEVTFDAEPNYSRPTSYFLAADLRTGWPLHLSTVTTRTGCLFPASQDSSLTILGIVGKRQQPAPSYFCKPASLFP